MEPLTPTSASPAAYTPVTPTAGHAGLPLPQNGHGDPHASEKATPSNPADSPARKKQRRNKPTLSCEECVERKTKARAIPIVLCAVCNLIMLCQFWTGCY